MTTASFPFFTSSTHMCMHMHYSGNLMMRRVKCCKVFLRILVCFHSENVVQVNPAIVHGGKGRHSTKFYSIVHEMANCIQTCMSLRSGKYHVHGQLYWNEYIRTQARRKPSSSGQVKLSTQKWLCCAIKWCGPLITSI